MLYPAELRSRRGVLCLQNQPFASAVGGPDRVRHAVRMTSMGADDGRGDDGGRLRRNRRAQMVAAELFAVRAGDRVFADRKSTRLNSSHT